jgi:diguanylate cyclase (GGDEF)-like protein/PAS domain S-box-containing protein
MALSFFARQWLFLGAGFLGLGGFVGWDLHNERNSIETLERERLATQARVVDENLARQLVATNLVLNSIRGDLPFLNAQKGGKALVRSRLQTMREAMPGIRALTLFNEEGILTARSPDQFVGQSFSKREYFQIARQGGDPSVLYVSPPFLAATGEYVINMAKVLSNERGVFAGVILASLDPEYFSVLLASVRYADDMRASLIHADGKLFLMIPSRPGVSGVDLAKPGTLFTRYRDSGLKVTEMTGMSFAMGKESLVAMRTINPVDAKMDKPLVLFVARNLSSISDPWRHDAYERGGMLIFMLMVTGVALNVYQQRQRAYDRLVTDQEIRRQQVEADLRISAVAFESQEAMLVTDADSVILRVNHAFTEITGYTTEEVVGQTPRLLKSDRHNADFYLEMWESIRRTGGWQGEIWDRRKDGEVYPKWLTISAVRNGDGVVTHYIGTHYDITERKKAEEKIRELAFFDQLTGLPNRTLLLDRLRQAMTAGNRNGTFGAVLFIDLDNFKMLNDTLGHDKGDLLLQQVAQRLTACVREGDTVARLGGDEFVVMLGILNDSLEEAATQSEIVGKKILAALNQVYQLGNVEHSSSASIGATLFCGHQTTIDDLLKQADLAMYKSKESGRNALHYFDPAMQAVVMERAVLDAGLRTAMQEQQFVLHYQSQVTDSGRIMGAEVLVRWQHPVRGMVGPGEFIPLAEETGLILPLGNWVLKTACTQLARWAAQPELAELTLSVNVSAHQFRAPDFVGSVLAILGQTGANPNRLKLELTESLLVANVEEVIGKMYALKSEGVSFSLDDFGTGYSSLSYLKRLPLDQLKIDQSFVRDVLIDPNDAAIAKTIVALANSLGLGVIAEGVETEVQRDFLASSGCHAYQGYFFSKPIPLKDFEALARQV